jgi:hypothetical protein
MIILRNLCVPLACLSVWALAENKLAELPYVGTAPTAAEPSGIVVSKKVDAKSCSFDDVAAVASNASPGTQVNIPAGTCDWGLQSLKVGAGVYIKGAGKNQTVIVRNPLVDTANAEKRGPGNFLIAFNCAPGKPNTLSNLTLQGGGKGGEMNNGSDARDNGLLLNGWKYVNGAKLSSPCDDFRIFNAKFSGFGFSAISVTGNPAAMRGVIFNNDFVHNYTYHAQNKGVVLGYGVSVMGDGSWPGLALGTADNIFIENNYMLGNRHHVASNNSSRYVFRYNTAISTASTRNHFALDAHGRSDMKNPSTGSRQYEIYNNIIGTDAPDGARTAIGLRGGDGVVFNNDISAQFRYGLELMLENPDDAAGKNSCKEVPDRISHLYVWDNKLPTRDAATNGVFSVCPDVVKLDRDYFLQPKKGYAPFTYPHPLRK